MGEAVCWGSVMVNAGEVGGCLGRWWVVLVVMVWWGGWRCVWRDVCCGWAGGGGGAVGWRLAGCGEGE